VREIGRPVDRINDPEPGFIGQAVARAFLAVEPVIRERLVDCAEDQPFRGDVCLGDDVEVAGLGPDRVFRQAAAAIVEQQFPCLLSQGDSEFARVQVIAPRNDESEGVRSILIR
jgi:hypothetical protein